MGLPPAPQQLPESAAPAESVEDDDDLPVAPAPKPDASGSRKRASSKRGRSAATEGQRALMRDADLFVLPNVSMLTAVPQELESAEMREEAAEHIIKLEDTLESFNISSKVVHYERGPVLTRYEVEPERGIRVNQVVRLADDLQMALAAENVRVEAPIPGKSAIGIEVPNPTRATVSLRGLLEDDAYQLAPTKLYFALGRDIGGKPVVVDLGAMPHLLIAGATGSGKSVCLHSLIVSLLMRATPEEVRMIMVDPKRVELAVYDGIPHLMAPVVHSVKQAADVLRKAIREMQKRYDKFALKGVVNLAEYNDLAVMPKQHATDEFDPLPHVVIIIDELADLMMQARAEFEFSICRLAQLARATGIHLVLATQRPSDKVVTGNIKANVPSRVALAVPSQHDSRTILDGQGAERLIGRGDMLYAPIDASKPARIQGAFVTRKDIERVVAHLRAQGEPQFDIVPEVPDGEDDFSEEIEASDELFAAAADYVMQEQEASVSMIQRRFKVGYARAGRLIDMMERRGIVGPHEGSKPRQVYVAPGAGGSLANLSPGADPTCPVPPDPRGARGQAAYEDDEDDLPLVPGLDDDEDEDEDEFDEDEEFDDDTDDE
jgi:S-DNA-T family DNA segregation ATPase FtsK/SpoIIIE